MRDRGAADDLIAVRVGTVEHHRLARGDAAQRSPQFDRQLAVAQFGDGVSDTAVGAHLHGALHRTGGRNTGGEDGPLGG